MCLLVARIVGRRHNDDVPHCSVLKIVQIGWRPSLLGWKPSLEGRSLVDASKKDRKQVQDNISVFVQYCSAVLMHHLDQKTAGHFLVQ